MKNLIFLLISLIVVSSCSIEKRLYNKGYSVQWHKSKPHKFAKAEPMSLSEVVEDDKIDLVELKPLNGFEHSYDLVIVEGYIEPLGIEVESMVNERSSMQQIVKEQESTANPVPELLVEKVVDPKPKKEGLALASLILGILALPILSIVFGLIQLKRIKNDPEQYGGEKMARAGVSLGVLYILIALAILAVLYGNFFIPVLAIVSIVLSVVGIIQLIQRSNVKGKNNFGIFFTIAGWLGLMFTTLLVFP